MAFKSSFIELDAAKWIVDSGFKSVCLDFPQDFIAREMPIGLFIIKNFKSIILYLIADVLIEDLMDLGKISKSITQICAIH